MTEPSKQLPFILLHPLHPSKLAGAIVTILVVLVLTHIAALSNITTHLIGGASGDAGLYFWLTRVHVRDLFTAPWFETPAFFPYGQTLAWSDNFILPGIAAKILTSIGIPLIASYNLILLGALFASGVCTYVLCSLLTNSMSASLLGALLFMLSPVVAAQIGHPQLQFTAVLPLFSLCALRFVQRPSFLRAVPLGLTITVALLTSVYYAVFLAVLGVVTFGLLILYRPTMASLSNGTHLLGGGLLGVLPSIPLLIPYLRVKDVFGERGLYEMFYFAADGLSYFSAPPLSLLYGATASLSGEEAHLFPGLLVLGLTVFALIRAFGASALTRALLAFLASLATLFVLTSLPASSAFIRLASTIAAWASLGIFAYMVKRLAALEIDKGFAIVTNRGLIAIFLGVSLVAAVLSMGPLGNPEKGHWALSPHALTYLLLPGIDAVRAVSRFGILVVFGLTIAGTLSAAHLFTSSAIKSTLIPPLFLFAAIDISMFSVPVSPPALPPSVLRQGWLPTETGGEPDGAIIVLPLARELDKNFRVQRWGDFARIQIDAMNDTFPLQYPIINGHSGQRPNLISELPMRLRGFPSERSIDELSRICALRYIAFKGDLVPEFSEGKFLASILSFPKSLKVISHDTDGSFLLEMTHESLISEPLDLLCPPHGNKSFEFELMGSVTGKWDPIEVTVDATVGSGTSRLATIPVLPNITWKKYEIFLPPSDDRVKPLSVRFSSKDKVPVYLKNQRLLRPPSDR